MRIRENTFQYC